MLVYILCILMTACNPPGPLEQTLRQAEDNRIELEEVLKYYQKDKYWGFYPIIFYWYRSEKLQSD